jgi:gas vesicle protein
MSDGQMHNSLERKRKLDQDLSNMSSQDWNDLVSKSNELLDQIQQENLNLYQEQLEKELDEMENAIRERNLEEALYHHAAAENYLKLLNLR